jgi:hypothetical protein
MRVKQETWFMIRSSVVTADDITRRLGVFPDETRTKGINAQTHAWQLRATGNEWAPLRNEPYDDSRYVSAQVLSLLARLGDVVGAIRQLADKQHTSVVLRVVRWYFPSRDEADLSFHLDTEALRFLLETGAEFDVAEYDMSLADEPELRAAREMTWGEPDSE